MIFTETRLKGAYRIDLERKADDRGFFARTYCEREMAKQGIPFRPVQNSISFNSLRGTLRGMHFQAAPHEEAKIVRCTMGAIYDVIVDLRPASATFKQWVAETLTADNRKMLFIPEGFAHGFLTLQDNTEALYEISAFYVPDAGRGVRWDDPAIGVTWPEPVRRISERDKGYPNFEG